MRHSIRQFHVSTVPEGRRDEAELWRAKHQAFGNLYGFLSQVIPYQDSDLEKFVFLRHLGAKPQKADRACIPVRR
jgi:type I restriction enzyme R subunit